MAPRKRTSPKKAPKRQAMGLLAAAASASGRFILSHPRAVFGTGSFVVIFSIISANALWYQTGEHPSPMLRTRDAVDPFAVIGYRNAERLAPEGNVTTFNFQRPEEGAAVEENVAVAQANPADIKRIEDIQRELKKRGLYVGEINGAPSQDLSAAILAFEEGAGLEPTGLASEDTLFALMVDSASIVAAIPKERPVDASGADDGIDPVAAAIRQAPVQQVKNDVKAPAASQPFSNPVEGEMSKDLIAQIQQGLINSSYVDVTVDGVAGPKTREAIRSFERHYRLPETGMPNELVLKKLKSIGAFNRPAL